MTEPGLDKAAEWLEADGLGGFASGTVGGIRTRRYHALLLAATTPPTGRMVLVNGCDAWIDAGGETHAVTSQRYPPDIVHPDGIDRLVAFSREPWPTWTFLLPNGLRVEQQLFVPHERAAVVVSWRLLDAAAGVRLSVRPFLSGRDFHALHHENHDFRVAPDGNGDRWVWHPYAGVPGIVSLANGVYEHRPDWYRSFLYTEERRRCLDCLEDLVSPGTFHFDLSAGPAVWILAVKGHDPEGDADSCFVALRTAEEARRRQLGGALDRAADAYLVRRGVGRTIIAGYPWFSDWGRDTFIALRGLCLTTGRLAEARGILVEWSRAVSQGMLPNRFPDRGAEPEYNSVDAALWFVIAVDAVLRAGGASDDERAALEQAIRAILSGYAAGTRYGIRADADGLLAAGELGLQLTWMDAKVGDRVVTPRIGKPVEIQALWINALAIGGELDDRFRELALRARVSFAARFWNGERGCLYDVVDADHVSGNLDASFRPNQIFAVGGLPLVLLPAERARQVVDQVEARLWTPLGLRTLGPGEPGYKPHYDGDPALRDAAYHQGTAWPWLLGPFVEAWIRVRGATEEARREARELFLAPLLHHLDAAGLGHVSEIVDGDPPFMPCGCPFQAWSLGELLRLEREVLKPSAGDPEPR
ncbi:MAG TPA: amylo-alpha-1,6-glucosidase [Thermoanaerobaculia bacterium]